MSMFDYGAVALKNGKLISTDFFTDMKDTCGFTDADNLLPGTKSSFDGNCFITIGNRALLLGFYKSCLQWWFDWGDNSNPRYEFDCECFGSSGYTKWSKWEQGFGLGSGDTYQYVHVTVKPKNGYYVAKFTLDNDKYKVYFGYGVDLDWYKKTKRVNYYTSPEYWFIKHIYWPLKDKVDYLKRKIK